MKSLPENATLYTPTFNTPVKGAVQILHGMCEHQKRYNDFARYLSLNGYVVVTSDLRGHGDNVARREDLGYFGDNAVSNLINDAHEITRYIKDHYPDVPYFLFGHSMGTFISTAYFKRYDSFLDGLFLSGMPGKNSAAGLGRLLCKILTSFKGEYHRSKFINSMVNGVFARPFKKEGSNFAWLASDPEVWEKYENDPNCGFVFTLNGFTTLFDLMSEAYDSEIWMRKDLSVPVRMMSGSDDPCMGGKRKLKGAAEMFVKHGYADTQYTIYKGQRHEILNDTDHMQVYEYVLSEMDRISKERS